MKFAIPAVTILLLGLAVGLHRTTRIQPAPRGAAASPVEEGQRDSLGPAMTRSEVAPVAIPVQGSRRSESAPAIRTASVPSWRRMGVLLERGLTLTSIQQPSVEQILKDRELEIARCHEMIRKSGLLDLRHYEWQVGVMKESWYRRIDALLDGAQHGLFVAIVEQGFFNEGLAFTHEPGMVVLE